MFVVIINFPPIKAGKDKEFREWFEWSNNELSKFKGFINRRLLKPLKEGNYAAIIEHESYDTFMAVQKTPFHDEAGKKVAPLLDGSPNPVFYEVLI